MSSTENTVLALVNFTVRLNGDNSPIDLTSMKLKYSPDETSTITIQFNTLEFQYAVMITEKLLIFMNYPLNGKAVQPEITSFDLEETGFKGMRNLLYTIEEFSRLEQEV